MIIFCITTWTVQSILHNGQLDSLDNAEQLNLLYVHRWQLGAAGGRRLQQMPKITPDAKNYPRCQKLPQMPKITPDAKKCLGGLVRHEGAAGGPRG